MKTARYFRKENALILCQSGKWGNYGTINGTNFSEKRMIDLGYKLETLSISEAKAIRAEIEAHNEALRKAWREQEMRERSLSVFFCLTDDPILITPNPNKGTEITHIANIQDSPMFADAYKGCGKGTAYVRDGHVVAYHYGHEQPANAPKDVSAFWVDLSCYQICFR